MSFNCIGYDSSEGEQQAYCSASVNNRLLFPTKHVQLYPMKVGKDTVAGHLPPNTNPLTELAWKV